MQSTEADSSETRFLFSYAEYLENVQEVHDHELKGLLKLPKHDAAATVGRVATFQ